MVRQDSVGRRRALSGLKHCGTLLALLAFVGCMPQETRRAQSEEESEHDRYHVNTVGEVVTVGNVIPRQIAGVGLVVGLDGTGAPATNDQYRTMLEEQLQKRGVKDAKKELMDPSNSHALVLVTAQIPRAAVKGDRLDVEIALPPGSNATSLKGGYLRECWLYEYESSRNLSPSTTHGDGLLQGHMVAIAEGPVLVGFGDGDEEVRIKQGKIWGGARSLDESPLMLIMNGKNPAGRVAEQVAIRINATFPTGPRGNPNGDAAHARDNRYIESAGAAPVQKQPGTIPACRLLDTAPRIARRFRGGP